MVRFLLSCKLTAEKAVQMSLITSGIINILNCNIIKYLNVNILMCLNTVAAQ